MCAIVDQAGYVVLGHLGELFLEDTFESCEDDKTLSLVVVINHAEFDLAISFLDDCGFLGKRNCWSLAYLWRWFWRVAAFLDSLVVGGSARFLGCLPLGSWIPVSIAALLRRVMNSQFSFIGPILVGVVVVLVARAMLDANVFSSWIPSLD